MDGGEARQLTDLPKGAGNPVWSPDGRSIAFSSTTLAKDLEKKDKPEEISDVRVINRAVYRANGGGYLETDRPAHIWTVPAQASLSSPQKPVQLTTGPFSESDITWSRDGNRILFISNRESEPYYKPASSEIYSVDAQGRPSPEGSCNRRRHPLHSSEAGWNPTRLHRFGERKSGAFLQPARSVRSQPQCRLTAQKSDCRIRFRYQRQCRRRPASASRRRPDGPLLEPERALHIRLVGGGRPCQSEAHRRRYRKSRGDNECRSRYLLNHRHAGCFARRLGDFNANQYRGPLSPEHKHPRTEASD